MMTLLPLSHPNSSYAQVSQEHNTAILTHSVLACWLNATLQQDAEMSPDI